MLKEKKVLSALICFFMLLPAVSIASEADALRKKIMSDQKKLVVMENMDFTAAEGAVFWPIYEELQEELFQVNQQVARIVVAYAAAYQTMSDNQALKITSDYYSLRKARIEILDKYLKELFKKLPAKKVFRYFQVENKLESIGRYELSKKIPMIQ